MTRASSGSVRAPSGRIREDGEDPRRERFNGRNRSFAESLELLSTRLEHALARTAVFAIFGCLLTSVALAAIAHVVLLTAVPLLGLVLTCFVALAAPRPRRAAVISVFAWALLARIVAVIALVIADPGYAQGDFLSPDGRAYLSGSRALLEARFAVPSPVTYFGTYDVGHYYLFAGASALLGSSVVALELLNGALAALSAALLFVWATALAPKHAGVLGSVAALSPSLILLSTANLLKDPSIVFATAIVLWAVTKLALPCREPTSVATRAPWLCIALIALVYLHLTRFYVAAYLELGLLIAAALALLRNWRAQAPGLLAILVLVISAEAGSLMAGWPPSPVIFVDQLTRASAIRDERTAIARTFDLEQLLPEAMQPMARSAVGAVRRLCGPFLIVIPDRLDARYVLAADFALYPDTLLWLLVLPAFLVGVGLALKHVWTEPQSHFDLGYVAIFLGLYLAQYLAIDVSYRQREDVLPIALAFVPAGVAWLESRHARRLAFFGYLVVIAFGQALLLAIGGGRPP